MQVRHSTDSTRPAASRTRRRFVPFTLISAASLGIACVVATPEDARSGDDGQDPEAVAQDNRFVARFQRGQRLLGRGSDEEAEKLFRELIAEKPEEATVHHALAVLLQFRKRPDDAATEFLTASRLAPEDAVIQRDTGLHLLNTARAAEAEKYLATACKLWPDDVEASIGLAAALRALGRLPAAEAEYRRAVGLEANSVDAAVGLAACVLETRPAEALKLIEKATGQWPDVLLVRGMALLRLERREEAVTILAKVVDVAPAGPAGVSFMRGAAESLTLCGDAKAAGVAATKWFDAESSAGAPSEAACFCLAATREAAGDHVAALAALDKAPAAATAATQLLQAALLVRAGRKDDAKAVLDALASSTKDVFESAAATRLLGRTSAADFAKLAERPDRANDVAWIESLVAESAGDAAAAATSRARAADLSKPPGEFPGLLVRPATSTAK